MVVIPTKSQPCRQGSFFSSAGISCTHTHTPKGKQFIGCVASTAVHTSKALWIDVSRWGCCWHLELGDSLLYSSAPHIVNCSLSQAPADSMPVGCPVVIKAKRKKASPVFKCPPRRVAAPPLNTSLLQVRAHRKSVFLQTSSRLPSIALGPVSFVPVHFSSLLLRCSFNLPVLWRGGYWAVVAVLKGTCTWMVPACI